MVFANSIRSSPWRALLASRCLVPGASQKDQGRIFWLRYLQMARYDLCGGDPIGARKKQNLLANGGSCTVLEQILVTPRRRCNNEQCINY